MKYNDPEDIDKHSKSLPKLSLTEMEELKKSDKFFNLKKLLLAGLFIIHLIKIFT
jgi:hypothetical protein